jgi:hypothetical protein
MAGDLIPDSLKTLEKKGMGLSNIETSVKSINGVFILESTRERALQHWLKTNLILNDHRRSDSNREVKDHNS